MVTIAEIKQAAERIKGYAQVTPLLQCAALDEAVGATCFIKPENLQVTGSFKFRGAYNRLCQLSRDERQRGVVAWSSGNHAQGVAAAARLLCVSATIIMPRDAPKVKIERTQAYGAEIVLYDRANESREEIATTLAEDRGAIIVPSFDDPHIIAGQGTAGLEMVQQVAAHGPPLDMLLVCCGGGGLIAGISTVFQALSPRTKVYSVEPAAFNDYQRSLVSGRRETNNPGAQSICDALLTPRPGALTFAINQATLAGGLSVTDHEVRTAMRFAFEHVKLVVEPGGAVALAAALTGKIDLTGKRAGIVLTGGNVDPPLFSSVL